MLIKLQAKNFSKLKTIVRFEQQAINWKKIDFLSHATAFSLGLKENNINKKCLLWMDSNHSLEYITALMGCKLNNVECVSLQSTLKNQIDENSLKQTIQQIDPELFVISPNYQEVNGKRLDLLYRTYPELKMKNQGENTGIQNLKAIVQTGFYGQAGTIKFRDFLLYQNEELKNLRQKLKNEKTLKKSNYKWKELNKINFNDLVYWIGNFENQHEKLNELCDAILNEQFLTCFMSENQYKQSKAQFLKDYSDEQPLTLIGNLNIKEELSSVLEEKKLNWMSLQQISKINFQCYNVQLSKEIFLIKQSFEIKSDELDIKIIQRIIE